MPVVPVAVMGACASAAPISRDSPKPAHALRARNVSLVLIMLFS